MKEKIYVFTITYNFDGAYIAKKCNTFEEAMKMMNDYLEEEIKTIKDESGYEPSIIKWSADDVTFVYAEGYTNEFASSLDVRSWEYEDCAYYRIFIVEI